MNQVVHIYFGSLVVTLLLLALPLVGVVLLQGLHVGCVELVEVQFVELCHDPEAAAVEEEVEHFVIFHIFFLRESYFSLFFAMFRIWVRLDRSEFSNGIWLFRDIEKCHDRLVFDVVYETLLDLVIQFVLLGGFLDHA